MFRFLLPLILLAAPLTAQVTITEGPAPGQLYPRDLVTNQAVVPVAGEVSKPGKSRVHLVVTRDGAAWSMDTVDLHYTGGVAPFAFAPVIDAGLHDYAFELLLEGGGFNQQVGRVRWVACGDAYLINGQSNAVATDYHNEGLGNSSRSRWIRSYGSASLSAAAVAADTGWYAADGIDQYSSGSVGAWGLRAARLLVDRYQVPVALLNGAVGGTVIEAHQRDDADPENLNTIYGRLLYRARRAGIDLQVRAMLWHQGESNGAHDPLYYHSKFSDLRDDWLVDFPALEQLFVFQIRKGCGVPDMDIREVQRQFPDLFADLTAVPTAGIDEHDGCHYYYAGYREMGDWMAAAMAAALYGEQLPQHAAPPNIREARFTGAAHDEIELLFRDPHQALFLDLGIEDRLKLRDGVAETVVTATASPGRILLQLSGPTAATRVAFIGQAGAGPWIKNQRGVGAFTFEVPILP
ncbi:MAG: hypothetical protein ISR76_01520 [Planctomycetes bacterium]|nr:hypothetical protein [Planctomycetota bacterium]MBL7007649.1 hypothetical protein [Planctomycetota bacterium]